MRQESSAARPSPGSSSATSESRATQEEYYDPRNSFPERCHGPAARHPDFALGPVPAPGRARGDRGRGHRAARPLRRGRARRRDAGTSSIRSRATSRWCARTCATCSNGGPGYRGNFNPEWLKPADNRAILARMLFNLRGAYLGQNDWPKAVLVIERLVVLQPEVASTSGISASSSRGPDDRSPPPVNSSDTCCRTLRPRMRRGPRVDQDAGRAGRAVELARPWLTSYMQRTRRRRASVEAGALLASASFIGFRASSIRSRACGMAADL